MSAHSNTELPQGSENAGLDECISSETSANAAGQELQLPSPKKIRTLCDPEETSKTLPFDNEDGQLQLIPSANDLFTFCELPEILIEPPVDNGNSLESNAEAGQLQLVPSLTNLCTDAASIEGMKPTLENTTSEKLLNPENANPHLLDHTDTDEFWEKQVKANYPNCNRLKDESWHQMFLRCQNDPQNKLNALIGKIKNKVRPGLKTKMAFVDTMVKPPPKVRNLQQLYGTADALVTSPAARIGSLSAILPNIVKAGDSRLKDSIKIIETEEEPNPLPKKPRTDD